MERVKFECAVMWNGPDTLDSLLEKAERATGAVATVLWPARPGQAGVPGGGWPIVEFEVNVANFHALAEIVGCGDDADCLLEQALELAG